MVFARSYRPLLLSLAGLTGGLVAIAAGDVVALAGGERVAAPIVLLATASALPGLVRITLQLRRWPVSKLGFFRDRFVLVQGRTALQVSWGSVVTATLADEVDWWTSLSPGLSLTERLVVRLEPTRRVSFWPAATGLEPSACRDLILRLRDEPSLRQRLPEFESMLDLAAGRLLPGEQIRPVL